MLHRVTLSKPTTGNDPHWAAEGMILIGRHHRRLRNRSSGSMEFDKMGAGSYLLLFRFQMPSYMCSQQLSLLHEIFCHRAALGPFYLRPRSVPDSNPKLP